VAVLTLARHNWQDDIRQVLALVIDLLVRNLDAGRLSERFARVEIAIVLRKCTRRDLYSEPMALTAQLAGIPQIKIVIVNMVRARFRQGMDQPSLIEPGHGP
jgi:hypothetical protein